MMMRGTSYAMIILVNTEFYPGNKVQMKPVLPQKRWRHVKMATYRSYNGLQNSSEAEISLHKFDMV